MTTARTWLDALVAQGACVEAVAWAQTFDSFDAAWTACERGDWLLWWIGRTVARKQGPERRRLVKVACQCARLALPRLPEWETRPLRAIETAERWARGEEGVTLDDVQKAADAASRASYASAAADAADAAADAACAAYGAVAASYAAAYAARRATLRQCADLVRAEYPAPPSGGSDDAV